MKKLHKAAYLRCTPARVQHGVHVEKGDCLWWPEKKAFAAVELNEEVVKQIKVPWPGEQLGHLKQVRTAQARCTLNDTRTRNPRLGQKPTRSVCFCGRDPHARLALLVVGLRIEHGHHQKRVQRKDLACRWW
jgi:hypothetical protein